jgi:hypothetical protein
VRDDLQNDAAVELEEAALTSNDSLTIEMRDGGGFLGRFAKE